MKLQTHIPIQKQSNNQIDYDSNVLLLGSCFSDNIGKKLDYFKFQNLQNPFGILFHPSAIERLITNAINKKEYSEKDIFFYNEQWHCFDSHSKLSNISKEGLLNDLNENIKSTYKQIHESSHIIITLGTAWIYYFNGTNSAVANCHKVPQKEFAKKLLTVNEIAHSFETIVRFIKSINTKTSVIFTVSPIRHLKDGFIENTQSKAHLITAIHQYISPSAESGIYFPSYEIMMDELRDYRFYKEDMIHPNQVAINYIWEYFKTVWISGKAHQVMREVDSIQKGLQHKPFNMESEAHQKFVKTLEVNINKLQSQFSHIKF
jgi:hypothetical protein